MDIQNRSSHPGQVFSFLVLSVLTATGISLLRLPPHLNNFLVLAIAFIMTGLVVIQYMGLRVEGKLVRWVMAVPVVLLIILLGIILPDVDHIALGFLGKF